MDAALRELVCSRADDRCEYCQIPQAALPFSSFHVDHIVPRQHGGTDDVSNLAWSCARCNRKRGTNLTSIDPDTGKLVVLFKPRVHEWVMHFAIRDAEVVGLTDIGRATARLLDMNDARRIQLREEFHDFDEA
jgi:hypothetical protein